MIMLDENCKNLANVFSENGKLMEICRYVCNMLHVLHVNQLFLLFIHVRKQVNYIQEKSHIKHRKRAEVATSSQVP